MKTMTHSRLRQMVLCALFAALTAVCSQIAVPMPWGVPVNLALFSAYLAGSLLGPLWGTVSQLVYLALALIGIPVMAGFSGGPGALFNKTGGYVLGYVVAALLVGMVQAMLGRGFWRLCFAMVVGAFGCYALGTLWFMVVTGTGLWQSLVWCVLPYLPGDALKIVLAVVLTLRLNRQFPLVRGK